MGLVSKSIGQLAAQTPDLLNTYASNHITAKAANPLIDYMITELSDWSANCLANCLACLPHSVDVMRFRMRKC